MTISKYIFYCRGSIFNSSKLPVPWKPCGLYRGGDLCRSHRAEDGRYVSFWSSQYVSFWRYVGFCSSQYVSFWWYVGFYFVDDMWVFSGIILFMIFEYGSIIKLDLICWSPQIMWIMWILSQKQVCVRGDKFLLKSSFVPFHQYYPIQSTTYICSFPPMTQEPFGEYILLKAYNFDNDWLIDFAGKSLNRIEFSQENISSFPPTHVMIEYTFKQLVVCLYLPPSWYQLWFFEIQVCHLVPQLGSPASNG